MRERGLLLRLADAQALLESGQHAALLEHMGAQSQEELERFPELMVLCAIAHARLGQYTEGTRWAQRALDRAVARGHRAVEIRTLNVLGAIALESGNTFDATLHFTKAIALAKREGDHGTVGRCASNLGVIGTMSGDYPRAIGWYTMALASYQRLDIRAGTAEVLCNLTVTYRDMGDFDKALSTADAAVDAAEGAGEHRLANLAYGSRAEVLLLSGDVELARREIEQAIERERTMGDLVGETEDLRVLAGVEAASGRVDEALELLRMVIERALSFPRPLLVAYAQRDLARLLHHAGDTDEALAAAETARGGFTALGLRIEVAKLDALVAVMRLAQPVAASESPGLVGAQASGARAQAM